METKGITEQKQKQNQWTKDTETNIGEDAESEECNWLSREINVKMA